MRLRNQHPSSRIKAVILLIAVVSLGACSKQEEPQQQEQMSFSGGRSGMIVNDWLSAASVMEREARKASLMGIYVSKYLAQINMTPVNGGLNGIQTQTILQLRQENVGDPDFQLLQAFADVLQVDVSDMLNRSLNRQESLDAYANALTNVAARANARYKDLTAALKGVQDDKRTKNKELGEAKRALKKAIDAKDFTLAGDLQEAVSEKEQAYSTADLREKQIRSILDTLDQLLTLFGQRILSIQRNREALIAGTRVVDMPGVTDLDIIRKGTIPRERGNAHDAVFDQLQLEQSQTGSGL